MKTFFTLYFITIFCNTLISQTSIWNNSITGTDPSSFNPYTSGDVVSGNITVSGIGRGSGLINTGSTNDRYNMAGWNSSTLDPSDYFSFTLTPATGGRINFSSLHITLQVSAQGPVNFFIGSSLDNYSSPLGTITASTSPGTSNTINLNSIFHVTTSITFRIFGWNASSSSGTFSVNDFDFKGSALLPVQLASFELTNSSGKPQIFWSTYSESNNKYFVIQHSKNGLDFTEVMTVNGSGSSDQLHRYSVIDPNPFIGINYYRLKQVDLDKKITIYPAKSIYYFLSDVLVYPTFFKDRISYELPSTADYNEWQISDVLGTVVLKNKIEYLSHQISLSALIPGMYLISFISQVSRQTIRIIKI